MLERLRQSAWFWVGLLVGVQGLIVAGALALQRSSGPILFTDEMGYLGGAAELAGQGEPFLGRTPKYTIGYSTAVAVPLRFVGGDPWRIAVAVNIAAALLLPVLCFLLVRRLSDLRPGAAALIAAVAAAYPAIALHAPRAWPETVLAVVVVGWALVALAAVRHRTAVWCAALGVVSGFTYMVHHRTVALGLAAGLVFVWIAARDRPQRRAAIVAGGAGLLALVVTLVVGLEIESTIYDRLYVSTSDSATSRVTGGFEPQNWWKTARAAIGQIWYLQVATFGAAGLMVAGAWSAARGDRRDRVWLTVVTLAFVGSLAVAASGARNGGRTDFYVYGRYIEVFVPLLIATGLALLSRRDTSTRVSAVTWSALTIAPLTLAIGLIRGFDTWDRNVQKVNLFGIIGLDNVAGERGEAIISNLDVFVIAVASAAAATAMLVFVRRRPGWAVALLGLALVGSTMAAAGWSLRDWLNIFEDASVDAVAFIEPEGEFGVVLGQEGEPRYETLNSVSYRTGYPTAVLVDNDVCPDVRYVVASEAWAPDYPVRVATTLTPFGGVVYEVDCA